jgi:hypothetical protein
VSVLVGLEGQVVHTLQSIKKGINLLDERRAELRAGIFVDDGEQNGEFSEEDEENEVEEASQPVRS